MEHTAEVHAQVARAIFSEIWLLLEKEERTPREMQELVHAAHAHSYHWMKAEETVEELRGEWLVAHVYCRLGHGEEGLRHADRCMELFTEHREAVGYCGEAYAFEALARAHAVLGNHAEATEFKKDAQLLIAKIEDAEQRALFEQIFWGGDWHGVA